MKPASALMVNVGNKFAVATPIWALAECNCSSAARTSGRCSMSCDGKLTGKSAGR
jgi:hypothetical protein